jgi:hypothetical protein
MKAVCATSLLFVLWGAAARAELVMSLTPSLVYGGQCAEIVFSGTLTNSSATDKIFLNDIAFTLSGASATNLAPDSNAFFANAPGILLPGENYTGGEIFRVVLGASAPLGDYSGTVGVNGGADINATTSLASTTFTVRETPMENWRVQNFGVDWNTPQAADTGDFDHDGIANLLEYALDLNPKSPDVDALPQGFLSGGYLTLSFLPNALATDVNFAVESSIDLVNWSTDDVQDVTPTNPNPPGSKTFRYNHPIDVTPRVFLRLKVTR